MPSSVAARRVLVDARFAPGKLRRSLLRGDVIATLPDFITIRIVDIGSEYMYSTIALMSQPREIVAGVRASHEMSDQPRV
jgi:hypothetical protein